MYYSFVFITKIQTLVKYLCNLLCFTLICFEFLLYLLIITVIISRIVSPGCLRTCFVEAISIPENNSPVYTLAMRNVVLSVSNLNPKEKVYLNVLYSYVLIIFF